MNSLKNSKKSSNDMKGSATIQNVPVLKKKCNVPIEKNTFQGNQEIDTHNFEFPLLQQNTTMNQHTLGLLSNVSSSPFAQEAKSILQGFNKCNFQQFSQANNVNNKRCVSTSPVRQQNYANYNNQESDDHSLSNAMFHMPLPLMPHEVPPRSYQPTVSPSMPFNQQNNTHIISTPNIPFCNQTHPSDMNNFDINIDPPINLSTSEFNDILNSLANTASDEDDDLLSFDSSDNTNYFDKKHQELFAGSLEPRSTVG